MDVQLRPSLNSSSLNFGCQRPDDIFGFLKFWTKRVNEDAEYFRRSCHWRRLRCQDKDLAYRLLDQETLFMQACIDGDIEDIEAHGSALCCGYMMASKALGGPQVGQKAEGQAS
jgi:hypothetical protein